MNANITDLKTFGPASRYEIDDCRGAPGHRVARPSPCHPLRRALPHTRALLPHPCTATHPCTTTHPCHAPPQAGAEVGHTLTLILTLTPTLTLTLTRQAGAQVGHGHPGGHRVLPRLGGAQGAVQGDGGSARRGQALLDLRQPAPCARPAARRLRRADDGLRPDGRLPRRQRVLPALRHEQRLRHPRTGRIPARRLR
eukprot:scaffold102707_cov67-Phaeocystis_antarctica.AAC.1